MNTKLILILLLSLVATPFFSPAQQINNGDFESWQLMSGYSKPDSFYTRDQSIYLGVPTTEPTTDAHSGTYAAKINTIQAGSLVLPGTAVYGSFQTVASVNYFVGWPYVSRPASLVFWYKYSRSGSDTAMAYVLLSKWTGSQTIIGSGITYLLEDTAVYTRVEIPITYSSGLIPDTIMVGFISSYNVNPTAGTTLYVDDVSLDFGTGLESPVVQTDYTIFPNPASTQIKLTSANRMSRIEVYDMLGKRLIDRNCQGSDEEIIDISSLVSGLYVTRVETAHGVQTERLIKVR